MPRTYKPLTSLKLTVRINPDYLQHPKIQSLLKLTFHVRNHPSQSLSAAPTAQPDFRKPVAAVAAFYLGLMAAQGVYVFHFLVELLHLIEAAFGSQTALQALITCIGYKTGAPIITLNETVIMLVVLTLIDVVMISNLLIMVIVGGYETFVKARAAIHALHPPARAADRAAGYQPPGAAAKSPH